MIQFDEHPCATQRACAALGGWHVLIACLFLNQTSRKVARPALQKFFERFPTPEAFRDAEDDGEWVFDIMMPMGFVNRRTVAVVRLTTDWLEGKRPERPGDVRFCGQYCLDSYNIFVRKIDVEPRDDMDGEIRLYLDWRAAQEES